MNEFKNKLPLVVSAAIVLVLATFHFIYLEGMVARNDDVAMLGYVSGELFTYVPSEYMVHINVIVGYILKYLFIEFPSYNWYAIFFQILIAIGLFIGLTGAASYIYKHRSYTYIASLLMFIYIYFSIYSSLHITYTLVAIILGCGGLLLWLFTLEEDREYTIVLVVSILFFISSLLRVNSFLLIIVVSLPVIVYLATVKRKRTVLILSITSLLVVSGILIHSYYENSDDSIREYREYSNVRERVHGRPHLYWDETMSADLEKIGWSENDLLMFRSWNYADKNIFSKKSLEEILKIRTFSTFDTWEILKTVIKRDWRFIPVFLCLLLVVLLMYPHKKVFLFISVLILWYTALVFLLATFMRFPTRIAYGFYCASLINIGMVPVLLGFKVYIKNSYARMAMFVVALTCMYIAYNASEIIKKFSGSWEYQAQFTRLTELDPEALYIVWGSSMAIDQYPAKLSPKSVPRLNIVFLAWPTFSPYHYEMLERYGLNDLYVDMLDKNDIYLVAQEWRIDLLKKFMRKHYNMEIYVTQRRGLPKIGTVYKLSKSISN